MRALFLGWSVAMLVFPVQSGAEVVWVDANGRTIAPLVGDPNSSAPNSTSLYLAPDGLVWGMHPETATVFVREEVGVLFADPECTEPAYVSPQPPRWVFTTPNSSCAWARPDDLAGETIPVVYGLVGSVCTRFGPSYLIAFSKLIAVDPTPPDLGACPPLHIERRDPE